MRISTVSFLLAALAAGFAAGVPAQSISSATALPAVAAVAPSMPPATELIRNDKIKVLQGDYDADLARLPVDARAGFGTDIGRINTLLASLLVTKTLAADARAAGLENDPETQRRIALEVDRILSLAIQQRLEEQWSKEFDTRPGMEQAARERWLTQQDKFRTPEQIQVTHILFEVPKHKRDEALKLAQDTRAKVVAGADMNKLAKEVSEDPSAQRNDGRIDWRSRGDLDPQFARAAFALGKTGDISEPVQSKFGWHVIRLDARRQGTVVPFEQVKAGIIRDMKKTYVEQRRAERLASIRNDPTIVVNEPAVESLVKRAPPELLRKIHEDAAAAQAAHPPADTKSPIAR